MLFGPQGVQLMIRYLANSFPLNFAHSDTNTARSILREQIEIKLLASQWRVVANGCELRDVLANTNRH
jgi:hypothetical protein